MSGCPTTFFEILPFPVVSKEVVEVREFEHPVRRAGEVLVRMHAATLNQVDLYMRNSGAGITHELPLIMGLDGAGIVEEVDSTEALLSLGQKVVIHPGVSCGRCEFCQRGEGGTLYQVAAPGRTPTWHVF